MPRGVNTVILVGHIGKDPEMSYTPSGLAIAKFSLATSEKRKDDTGSYVDKTEWHRIVMFGKVAEVAGQYLSKGSLIYLEGKLSYGSYDKDGVKHYTTDIIGNSMQMLSGKDDEKPKAKHAPPTQSPPSQEEEEDLPF